MRYDGSWGLGIVDAQLFRLGAVNVCWSADVVVHGLDHGYVPDDI